ncbi:N-lysine methyltransferase SMYD2 [Escovopsis weberi]|uniref:N-lysine methyltransferase SMYD2 n=1 Tax=Escovopsis weberi TaxID=150374 RepID=A0A0M8MYQ1_ESCWE|nr:N-lysine methyltransferase SMYD2 [Escovopsis weberi]
MEQAALNEQLLERRQLLTEGLGSLPYDLILYLERAVVYSNLGYPDLAAGDAYRALLLTDEIADDSFEYHIQALESLQRHALEQAPEVLNHGELLREWPATDESNPEEGDPAVRRLALLSKIRAYQILSLSLLLCGCLQSALRFCDQGLEAAPDNQDLRNTKEHITSMARNRLNRTDFGVDDLPDHGLVRREVYPWNEHEPDRFSPAALTTLNEDLRTMAPKCAVQIAELPVLLESASVTDGSELAPLGSESESVECEDCFDAVFCNQECHNKAQERYHPAVCEKSVDTIAKDPEAGEADETLYLLLLARALALAAHQEIHPLDVREVKFIWGDFVPSSTNEIHISPKAGPPPQWTLPFSFKYNIETPLHVLERMDINIFEKLPEYDLWVLNTLYAKFRGTASARKNPRDGRPDVAAVHPYWCLANHDCNPNVTWEWGGRMVLSARETRVVDGQPGGIKRGEEILNHYCDVTLPVQERREWARGSLGGWCMCQRCRDESARA